MSNGERDQQIEVLKTSIGLGLRRAAKLFDVRLESDREQNLIELAVHALTTLEGARTPDGRSLKELRIAQVTRHVGEGRGAGERGLDEIDPLIGVIMVAAGIGSLNLMQVREGDVGLTLSNSRGVQVNPDDLLSQDAFEPMTLSLSRFYGIDTGDDLSLQRAIAILEGASIITVYFGSLNENLGEGGEGMKKDKAHVGHISPSARFFIRSSYFTPKVL